MCLSGCGHCISNTKTCSFCVNITRLSFGLMLRPCAGGFLLEVTCDTKLLSDIEAAKKMLTDEQSNKGQLRGIIQFMKKVAKLRKAKR